MTEYVIDIKHLQKYYGKHMGVRDVSLSVKKGEIFGFLGSNGAGKSTTIRCLLGLIRASKGEMTLFGGKYKTLTENLKHIGYIPSEAVFYPNMKVKDVILFAAKSRKKTVRKRRIGSVEFWRCRWKRRLKTSRWAIVKKLVLSALCSISQNF